MWIIGKTANKTVYYNTQTAIGKAHGGVKVPGWHLPARCTQGIGVRERACVSECACASACVQRAREGVAHEHALHSCRGTRSCLSATPDTAEWDPVVRVGLHSGDRGVCMRVPTRVRGRDPPRATGAR